MLTISGYNYEKEGQIKHYSKVEEICPFNTMKRKVR